MFIKSLTALLFTVTTVFITGVSLVNVCAGMHNTETVRANEYVSASFYEEINKIQPANTGGGGFHYSDGISVSRENFLEFFDLNFFDLRNPNSDETLEYNPATGVLILTQDTREVVGSTTLAPRIDMNHNFRLQAEVYLGSKTQAQNGGDGIGFAFHPNHTRDIGNSGNAMGIGGLPNAIGFKIDTFHNPNPNYNLLGYHRDPAGFTNQQFGAFVTTCNTFIRNIPNTRPGVPSGTMREQRGIATTIHTPQIPAQILPTVTNSQWHRFEIVYCGTDRIMEVFFTHRPSNQVFHWEKFIGDLVDAQYELGVESFGFSISASTGWSSNLHKFRLELFEYYALTGVVEALYLDIDNTETFITRPERFEHVRAIEEHTVQFDFLGRYRYGFDHVYRDQQGNPILDENDNPIVLERITPLRDLGYFFVAHSVAYNHSGQTGSGQIDYELQGPVICDYNNFPHSLFDLNSHRAKVKAYATGTITYFFRQAFGTVEVQKTDTYERPLGKGFQYYIFVYSVDKNGHHLYDSEGKRIREYIYLTNDTGDTERLIITTGINGVASTPTRLIRNYAIGFNESHRRYEPQFAQNVTAGILPIFGVGTEYWVVERYAPSGWILDTTPIRAFIPFPQNPLAEGATPQNIVVRVEQRNASRIIININPDRETNVVRGPEGYGVTGGGSDDTGNIYVTFPPETDGNNIIVNVPDGWSFYIPDFPAFNQYTLEYELIVVITPPRYTVTVKYPDPALPADEGRIITVADRGSDDVDFEDEINESDRNLVITFPVTPGTRPGDINADYCPYRWTFDRETGVSVVWCEDDEVYIAKVILMPREIIITVTPDGDTSVGGALNDDYDINDDGPENIVITFPPETNENNIKVDLPNDNWNLEITRDPDTNEVVVTITPPPTTGHIPDDIIINVNIDRNTKVTASGTTYRVDGDGATDTGNIYVTFPPGTNIDDITVNLPTDEEGVLIPGWSYEIIIDVKTGEVIAIISPPIIAPPPPSCIIIDVDDDRNVTVTGPYDLYYDIDDDETGTGNIYITFPPGTDKGDITVNLPGGNWNYGIYAGENGYVTVTITPPQTPEPDRNPDVTIDINNTINPDDITGRARYYDSTLTWEIWEIVNGERYRRVAFGYGTTVFCHILGNLENGNYRIYFTETTICGKYDIKSIDFVVNKDRPPLHDAITIEKRADKIIAAPGDILTYFIRIANTTSSAALNVTMIDSLDISSLTLVSGSVNIDTAMAWYNFDSEGVLTVTIPVLEPYTTVTVTFQTRVRAGLNGVIINEAVLYVCEQRYGSDTAVTQIISLDDSGAGNHRPPTVTVRDPGAAPPATTGRARRRPSRRPGTSNPAPAPPPSVEINQDYQTANTDDDNYGSYNYPYYEISIILPEIIEQVQEYEEIIRVPMDEKIIYRGYGTNWVETHMDTTAFISEQSSIMIPIRFLTYAMREPVQWDCDNALATLSSLQGDILITRGETEMTVNGKTLTITDRFGNTVPAFLRWEHDRLLIPMSALGTAFNVQYRWDEVAREAIFYPLRPLNRRLTD